MTGNLRIVKQALLWLPAPQRAKFGALVLLNASLAFLDLIGLALFALLGTVAVRGIQAVNLSPRTESILNFLGFNEFENQKVIVYLAIIASVLLICKTLISVLLNRRTQHFLGRIGAIGSARYINLALGGDLEVLEKTDLANLRFNATYGSKAIFTGILGGFVTIVTDGFLLLIMLLAIFLSSPLVALASTTLFAGASVTLHFIQRHKAFVLGSEVARVQLRVEQDLLVATQGFRELFVTNRIKLLIKRLESDFLNAARINADMSILPNIGKYVIEITLILGTLMAAAIQISIADAARATSVMAVFLIAASRVAPALLRIQQGLLSIRANFGTAFQYVESVKEMEKFANITSSRNFEILEKVPENAHKNKVFKAEIEIANLRFSYPNTEKVALDSITLSIKKSEKIAIVGASGSGKSTLMDLVVGLRKPKEGWVRIGGLSPTEAIAEWEGMIAYAPQKTTLIPGSFVDNLEFFLADTDRDMARVEKLIKLLALDERFSSAELINTKEFMSSELSGGESQRVGLARSLYISPDLLLLDEATSALDASLERRIVEYLMKKDDSRTVIAITHRISTIKLATRIIFMESGRITGDGSFEELYRTHKGFRDQIVAMKFDDSQNKLSLE